MIGQRLLHYQIIEKLGEGGMGVVYKARDTHLDRFVAIKVLPPDKVSDPTRKARFIQEAKAASALNHPNIITVHDISDDNGVDFIAMEYVDGKTLDQLIPRKGMRLNEALKVAIQIADALARAHAAGIIHRDLKPANIMMDSHGHVKVLDFGLAKLTERLLGEDESTTTAAVKTDEGTIAGTAAYMSPEQAEGKPLDPRSDIFSFGAVLYEMLSGQRAFHGDSKISTLAAVLHKDPPELHAEIPHDLHKLIARCLRKDPAKRFQHADDLQVALGEIREESESGKLPASPVRRSNGRLLLAICSLIAILTAAWWVWRVFLPAPTSLAFREIPFTSEPGYEMYPSFSPDGLALIYQQMPPPVDWGAAAPPVSIMVKMAGADSAAVLNHGAIMPAHSPDGRWIAFGIRTNWFEPSPTTIAVMPRTGGAERRIAEVNPGSVPRPPVWTPDSQGLITMDREQPASPYHLVYIRLETGEKRRLTQPPSGLIGDYAPALSPDGRTLAFSRRTGSGLGDLTLLPLDDSFRPAGEPRKLETGFRYPNWPAWTNDGKEIVFCSGHWAFSTLWRIRADGSGSPTRLPFGAPGAFQPAISPSGNRLAYIKHSWDSDIWRVELLPSGLPARKPEKFVTSSQGDGAAVWSPDGRHIAFASMRAGLGHPWIVDATGANPRQLSSVGSYFNIIPSWSPDSQWIAFAANSEGNSEVYIVGPRGGAPRNLTSHPADDINVRWSPDGRYLFFDSNRAGEYRSWKVSRDGGEASPAPDAPRGQVDASNEWRYYTRRDSGRLTIWREPAAGGQPERLVDNAGESAFALGPKGIYFVPRGPDANPYHNSVSFYDFATRRVTKVADLNSHLGILASTRPALSPDGRYLLYSLSAYETNDIILVENFK